MSRPKKASFKVNAARIKLEVDKEVGGLGIDDPAARDRIVHIADAENRRNVADLRYADNQELVCEFDYDSNGLVGSLRLKKA